MFLWLLLLISFFFPGSFDNNKTYGFYKFKYSIEWIKWKHKYKIKMRAYPSKYERKMVYIMVFLLLQATFSGFIDLFKLSLGLTVPYSLQVWYRSHAQATRALKAIPESIRTSKPVLLKHAWLLKPEEIMVRSFSYEH